MEKRGANAQDKVIIQACSLNKTYKKLHQQITVLNNINLEICQGEIVAITGTSGSGKSTLLHLLAGLDQPTSGQIIVDGQNLSKLSDKKLSQFRNQTIGFIFQSFYLHPFLTLEKNVEVPAMFLKMKRNQRTTQTVQLLQRVGLADWAKHFPKELSGGQIQRAAIARALINSPKIIFADEPTGNLDSTNSDLVIDLLKQIRQDLGTTIVLVTHNPEIVTKADRHITLKDGMIINQSIAPSTSFQSRTPITTKIIRKVLPEDDFSIQTKQYQTKFSTAIRHKTATIEPRPALTVTEPRNTTTVSPPIRLDVRHQQRRLRVDQSNFAAEQTDQLSNSQEDQI